jgi:hypothetical protein
MDECDNARPHDALGGLSPRMYKEKHAEKKYTPIGLRFASATHCSTRPNKLNQNVL